METVIRFIYPEDSVTIDFYADEIDKLTVRKNQFKDLFIDIAGDFNMYRIGYPYHSIAINFDLFYGDDFEDSSTLSRIEQIYNLIDDYGQPKVGICYYRYGIDGTTYSFQMQMKRDEMKWFYDEGKQDRAILPITFYESRPEGVGGMELSDLGG